MFESLDIAPADPILGLTELYQQDANPGKVNLGVGVYKDEMGKTPVLYSVKRAETVLHEKESTKNYLPIDGAPEYALAVQHLMFGKEHEVVQNGRAVTAHTPGGTAALRVCAEFIRQKLEGASVWLSDPTWPNHTNVFNAAGLDIKTYPYFDKDKQTIAFDTMLSVLRDVPPGDVVLLHGSCHNPTGVDPDDTQWASIAEAARQRGWIPLIDFAYQGFGRDVESDANGVRHMLSPGCEVMICSSFSKNFGLYRERVGALTVIAASDESAAKVQGHVKRLIRTLWSSPPSHGAQIVQTILQDPELCDLWATELATMCSRINGMRELLAHSLERAGASRDFSFLTRQCGMFSLLGLSDDQVARLRDQYAVYVVKGGRINVAGITQDNVEYIASAIADVLS